MMNSQWGIDLDGVCYDFVESVRSYLIGSHGFLRDELPETTSWNFYEDNWEMSYETYLEYVTMGVDEGHIFLDGDPIEGTFAALCSIKDMGGQVNIVTHRYQGKHSVQNTVEWLQREGIPFDTLTFAKQKSIVNNDVFIEDNVDNFMDLERNGIRSFLIDRPWNRYHDTPYRVFSWGEFIERGVIYLAHSHEREMILA